MSRLMTRVQSLVADRARLLAMLQDVAGAPSSRQLEYTAHRARALVDEMEETDAE